MEFLDDGSQISFTTLQRSDADVTFGKELAYFANFANLVPDIYGDDNQGGTYLPYNRAKEQLEQLGFQRVMYRTQPLIEQLAVTDSRTIFDFYQQILFPYGFQ